MAQIEEEITTKEEMATMNEIAMIEDTHQGEMWNKETDLKIEITTNTDKTIKITTKIGEAIEDIATTEDILAIMTTSKLTMIETFLEAEHHLKPEENPTM